MSLYLDDNANNWLMSLDETTLKDIQKFTDQFLQRYSRTTDTFSAMQDLKNMRQVKGQDPLQFVDDLANLYTKCKLDVQQIVPFTVAALEPDVGNYVRAQNPKTMQDVRTAITHFTGTAPMPKVEQPQQTDAAIKALCSRLDEVVMQLSAVTAIHQPADRQWTPSNRRDQRPSTTSQRHSSLQSANKKDCSFCGGRFHAKLSDCPARNKKCNKCGIVNHFAKVCRSKKE